MGRERGASDREAGHGGAIIPMPPKRPFPQSLLKVPVETLQEPRLTSQFYSTGVMDETLTPRSASMDRPAT